jgi:hypothetical protein
MSKRWLYDRSGGKEMKPVALAVAIVVVLWFLSYFTITTYGENLRVYIDTLWNPSGTAAGAWVDSVLAAEHEDSLARADSLENKK